MARLPHDGHAAVPPDVLDERLRRLHVEDDLLAGPAREQVAREEDQDEVRLVALAALVHDADAIGVAVVRDAEVGTHLDDPGLEVHHVLRVLGIRQVVRKAPVGFAVELDDLAADAAQQLGAVEPRDAVAGVHDDLEPPRGLDEPADRLEVVVARAPRRERAAAALELTALCEPAEELDLLLGERRGARVDQLHAVVRDRVVAARDGRAAVELPVRGGEVEDGRGHEADVHHVEPRRERAFDEAGLERARRQAIVLAHRDAASAVAADERAVRRADETEDVRGDVAADEAAHVVGAEHVRIQHCAVLIVTLS